jgi:hypothetical protein
MASQCKAGDVGLGVAGFEGQVAGLRGLDGHELAVTVMAG